MLMDAGGVGKGEAMNDGGWATMSRRGWHQVGVSARTETFFWLYGMRRRGHRSFTVWGSHYFSLNNVSCPAHMPRKPREIRRSRSYLAHFVSHVRLFSRFSFGSRAESKRGRRITATAGPFWPTSCPPLGSRSVRTPHSSSSHCHLRDPHVICHADLHPGNLLRNRAAQVFVVDWDDVMLAPKERDFIFVGEPVDGSAQHGGSPFFQGYGQTEIDWIALTYYRYERVAQDLIEYAQQVILREDLGEETKARAVRAFDANPKGRNMDAAQVAAARISPQLTIEGIRRDDNR